MIVIARLLLLFVLALSFYWGTARYFDHSATPDEAYFNQLADAFLQGQTYLSNPASTHDLTQHRGRWYVPFPPLPSLLMLPWVWAFGVSTVNTAFFCAFFGALNVALAYLLLEALSRRGWSRLCTRDNLWLTLLFGLGSVHWYMATIGSVWFVAQICTVTFVLLAVWLAVQLLTWHAPWLAGGSLALAALARPNVLLTWPLLVGIAAMHVWSPASNDAVQIDNRQGGGCSFAGRKWLGWTVASAVLPVLAVCALLFYNWLRFVDPFDFGYLTANVAEKLIDDLRTYGQFHLHYLAKNFWAMWLAGPQWNEEINFFQPNPEGMSLLITTPALVYLGLARDRTPLILGAWLALALLLVPLLLYYNTGWWQFGYRFSLDFIVPIMVLLALAAGSRVSGVMRLLILLGVIVNLAGVFWWHS